MARGRGTPCTIRAGRAAPCLQRSPPSSSRPRRSSLAPPSRSGPTPSATSPATRSAYTFEDLSLSLTSTRVLAGENDATALVPIGFSFGFYGTAETELYVSTNGLLSFGESYPWFVNRELDSPDLIGDPRLIAPLWHDWNFDGELQPLADAVYYETLGSPGSQRFVVQWNRAYNDTPTLSDPVTFQVVLFESGDILFHYPDVTTLVTPSNNGGSATVGIRNAGGTASGEFLAVVVRRAGARRRPDDPVHGSRAGDRAAPARRAGCARRPAAAGTFAGLTAGRRVRHA